MLSGDTIVAISSAVGPAARMIVRASGPDALRIASELWGDPIPGASAASRGSLRFANLRVPAWLYVFRALRSYTGENIVEFHIPGNPLLARMLLDELTATRGVRPADPGEFTARAYFNGRLDLTEAEGVAATIAAGSEQELRAARQLLTGELTRRLRPATDRIAETLGLVEVGIDFSDEDVTFLSPAQISDRVREVDGLLRDLIESSARFERLTHEPQVVLAGRPNAGKSTLLNALAGHERAVTSPVAGTTRDVLSADVPLARGIVKLTDAAGIEENPGAGEIERQMRRNALRAVESADVLVLVHDITDARPPLELPRVPDMIVHSKSDLATSDTREVGSLCVSAKTGENLDRFRADLGRRAFGESATGNASLALNARHVQAVSDARTALARAAERVATGDGAELIALELRESLDALGRVVGMISPDDLLGRIFSAFCIGK